MWQKEKQKAAAWHGSTAAGALSLLINPSLISYYPFILCRHVHTSSHLSLYITFLSLIFEATIRQQHTCRPGMPNSTCVGQMIFNRRSVFGISAYCLATEGDEKVPAAAAGSTTHASSGNASGRTWRHSQRSPAATLWQRKHHSFGRRQAAPPQTNNSSSDLPPRRQRLIQAKNLARRTHALIVIVFQWKEGKVIRFCSIYLGLDILPPRWRLHRFYCFPVPGPFVLPPYLISSDLLGFYHHIWATTCYHTPHTTLPTTYYTCSTTPHHHYHTHTLPSSTTHNHYTTHTPLCLF